jgi:hypothetical protein
VKCRRFNLTVACKAPEIILGEGYDFKVEELFYFIFEQKKKKKKKIHQYFESVKRNECM